jgi:L-lactate dehydrogenase (cytochrome)
LRSGEDIVKAYAGGADFAFLGRILQFAIAAEGEAGLNRFWKILKDEVSITLAQIGKTALSDI